MTTLIADIERFLKDSGMGPFRFGLLAVGNGRLVERLRDGGRVWPETDSKIRAFILVERERRNLPDGRRGEGADASAPAFAGATS